MLETLNSLNPFASAKSAEEKSEVTKPTSLPSTKLLNGRVFEPRDTYKEFEYPWAYDLYKKQQESHWMPSEVPSFQEDLRDWNEKLTDDERNLCTQIFRFFTQGDIDVAGAYCERYLPLFKKPELRMMLLAFASFESIHIDAYSQLIENIGMPETEYQAFQKFKEMKEKHEFLWDAKDFGDATKNLAFEIAKFSGFSEGMQLYSSFAMLMNFSQFNKMKNMSQIVAWSVRDESLHVKGMTKIFHEIVKDNPQIMDKEFSEEIYSLARKMVELEENFIDLAFRKPLSGPAALIQHQDIEIEGITKQEVKDFVRYTANRRLMELGFNAIFPVDKNPFLWFDYMVSAVEHANFFEQRGTDYKKVNLQVEDDEVVW